MTEQKTEMPAQATAKRGISDKALKRLVKWGALGLVVLVAAFSVVYYFGQHVNAGPSLSDRAVTTAEASVKSAPNDIGLRIALAQAYVQANRLGDALKQYDLILQRVPNHAAALMARAAINLQQGNLKAAKTDYNSLIALVSKGEFAGADPKIEAAHYYLAVIATKSSDWATAAGELRTALTLDPTDSDAWYLVGQVALNQKAPKSAVAAFNKALSFVPNGWCDPYSGLVQAYQAEGDAAHVAYETALRDFCQNRTDQAKSELKQLTSGPVAVDALLQLGAIAAAESDNATAISYFKQVLVKEPSNQYAQAQLKRLSSASPAATGGK